MFRELTIGDYIFVNGNVTQITAINSLSKTISFVDTETNEEVVMRFNDEEMKPIPITKELLDKIGIENCFGNIDENTSISRIVRKVYDNWQITRYGWKMVEVRFVHELQNVIKVCRIEREIIL